MSSLEISAAQRAIVHEMPLRCTAMWAFTAYTHQMGRWWDPECTSYPSDYRGIELEPALGGKIRFLFRGHDAEPMGDILTWRPGEFFAHSLIENPSDDAHSTVEVTFHPAPAGGTLVNFSLTGFSEQTMGRRRRVRYWEHLLERYAKIADP